MLWIRYLNPPIHQPQPLRKADPECHLHDRGLEAIVTEKKPNE
jgi:hypothetical protein